MTPERRGPLVVVVALAVAALSAIVFSPALGGGFILDDRTLVADDPSVHSLGAWRNWFERDFAHARASPTHATERVAYYRPAVTASYALDWAIGGGNPVELHATNLVWHAVAAACVFLTLGRWIGATLPAFCGALIWALHPTKAESVAWISG